MDLEYLREGREYSELPRSYVIFICTYDYIGADKPVYFYEKFDRQNCLQFGDEAYSIILNTACSPHKVPESLKPLFEYINDPSKGVGDVLVNHIDERCKEVQHSRMEAQAHDITGTYGQELQGRPGAGPF